MKTDKSKINPSQDRVEEHAQRNCLTVERTFGSQDLIELVADYIAEKIEIEYPAEYEKCKRTDC